MADWQGLAIGTAAWGAGFGIVRALSGGKRSWDFCNRCISMVHVFVCIYLCMASVRDWSRPLDGVGTASSPSEMRALKTSLAYFIYDFFCCLLDVKVDYANAVHHIVTIVGLGYGFVTQAYGPELIACLWLMELSNPFMHARELMKEAGIKDTPLNMLNDLAFVVVFTLARLGAGPFVVYSTLKSEDPLTVKLGAVGIQVISIFWFYRIARMVVYKLTKKKTKAQ
ncbi:hypothetical protein R1sor_009431 [Riccia sorocarpa]|uniref:TLC domain-containing protein n=1 Tax=Riccia sorocarpa TaxID=122646 RepID=A0ABD3HV22_9MARC